jgi:multidrug efflux system membrane fusion protein
LPEDNLPAVMKQVHAGATLSVTAYERTGTTELGKGHLETVDNQIDTTTGTVKLRAIFDNEQQILFPNQFVNIQLLVDTLHYSDIVPRAAIQHGAPGAFVYVVKPDQTVAVQKVKVGPADGQNIAVLDGLQPGEKVVVDGSDRLREGAKVTVAGSGGERHEPGEAKAAAEPGSPPPTDRQGQGGGRRRTAQ